MDYAVQCLNLTKRFRKTLALDNISLNIEKNKIYGLLGRNGAGKTTLLNIISTQAFETKGSVKVFGENPYENAKALDRMCLIKEGGTYLAQLKAKEILGIASEFYTNWDKDFAESLVEQFGLDVNKKYPALSKGTQSALGITIGLASRAPLTIYDEPYLGLDAAARTLFYDILLKDYMENPRTIILSTHLIDEVSNIFERVIILDKGKVVLTDDTESLRNKALYLSGKVDKVEEILRDKKVIYREQVAGMENTAVFDELSPEARRKVLINDIEIRPISLQEFFVLMTSERTK